MGYAEHRGTGDSAYWRGRYKTAPGHYATVSHPDGTVVKFRRKLDAKRASDAEETERGAAVRQAATEQAAGRMKFGTWVNKWYKAQDLASSTMLNYQQHVIYHLLPAFEDAWLDEIDDGAIAAWEAAERAAGYKPGSIRTWRATLHVILEDARTDPKVTLAVNPAARRRGRGRRSGRTAASQEERVITTALGALLIAERASILSGRDDEFTGITLGYYSGMRWAEVVGLEKRYVRRGRIRVEWQLYELPDRLEKSEPKYGSRRDIDLPPFLDALLAGHIARTAPQPCPCHGATCIFTAHGKARGAPPKAVTLEEIARLAGVSPATVSNVLNRPHRVADATRARVDAVITGTEFTPAGPPKVNAPHWRRSGFGDWLFEPAASGWYPAKAPQPRRPVPLAPDPWPGRPLRGRGNQDRAEACWAPVAAGLTPHGLRHSLKALMDELRVPGVLQHERLGHKLGGIAGVYSHVTPAMRAELAAQLAGVWEQALDARAAMCPSSPVRVLDGLLRERAGK